MRLGVFGGAFDPPHNAHVALANAAVSQLALDELRIFPTGQAWHKGHELTPAGDRVAMARIAFAGVARSAIDEREVHRAGPTYTIDTLRELVREHPGASLFLVMGEDQALSFSRWRECREVAKLATLAVAARPDAHTHATLAVDALPAEARVVRLQLPSMAESSTGIRGAAGRGDDFAALVPPAVASYIASHHLYPQTH